MSAQVLSFKQRKVQETERYLVLKAELDKDSENRFFLSPEIMHWRDDIWIIDLGRTQRYWLAQALNEEKSILEILEEKIYENKIPYQKWIQCSHPWQGLFLLEHLPDQSALYDFKSSFCQNRAKEIPWEHWLKESETLLLYLESHLKASRLQRFQSKKAQLLRAMDRLGLESVYDIKEADSSSMQKRFGFWVSKLWEWTFPEKEEELPLFQSFKDLNEFVWVPEKPRTFPIRHRALDYSVEQWDSLSPFLQEDFDYLKRKFFSQKKQSICEIEWTLELYNGTSIPLKVSFRNPYAIFSDAPDFAIALAQSKYQFDAWQVDIKEEKSYSDYPEAYKVVSWKLEVTKSLFCELKEQNLSSHTESMNYFKILDLENKLPKPVKQYRSKKSFLLTAHGTKALEEDRLATEDLWKYAGSLRPLFKYKESKKINRLGTKSYFLERNTRDWWTDKHPHHYNQDFFKLYQNRKWKWISKSSTGEIFELGQFD